MNALITGGSGFVGSHLVSLLAESGFHVLRIIDLCTPRYLEHVSCEFYQEDLVTIGEWPELLDGIDVVFHLAWSSVPESSTRDPFGDVVGNLVPTIRLLEQCVAQGVRRVIFASTGGAIYGVPTQLPVSENHPTEPISAYGISKLAAEKYFALFHRLYDLEYAILRPSVPYGEYQNPLGRQGAVAVFFGKILQRKPIVIWGNADGIVRDFFHVADLARAYVLAANSDNPSGIYNVGGGTGVSLASLIDVMRDVVGPMYPIEIQSLQPRPFDVPEIVLDISRASTVLGWKPEVDLASGLQRTWAWVRTLPGLDAVGFPQ